ncbi:MAG TPA: DUF445 domain-containing protein [Candidatus Elarobacter sp.]|nr:DUF445 domain-containing protein [Candidatus Elarobacter sp.]
MKTIATALLGVMAIVFAISARLKPAYPLLAWVEAFSEAALIGGLADWFAVVALFRHPGGVPFPHTAIVPHNKDRIGAELGIFVEQNFLTPSNIAARMRELDVARSLLGWLAVPANWRALLATAREGDIARAAGSALEIVTEDGAHQRILGRVLPVVAGWLDGQRREIKRRFARRSMLTPGFVDAYIVNRFVDGMIDLIGEVATTPDHPMRAQFDAYLRELAVRLREDPDLEAHAERLRTAQSAVARFGEIAAKIAASMLEEPALVERLDARLCDAVEAVLGRFSHQFSALIDEVVRRWDAEMITEKIETELGPDLQFIRLNGSLVGGAAGVVLHAALVISGAG